MRRPLAAVAVTVAVVALLAGCGGGSATQHGGGQVLQGLVIFYGPVNLPKNAAVHVTLNDLLAPVGAKPVAQQTIPTKGGAPPYKYQIQYDQKSLAVGSTYGLSASIRSGAKTLYQTNRPIRIPTTGSPAPAYRLIVEKVG